MKRLVVVLLSLFLLCAWAYPQQLDGYCSVPVEQMQSWLNRVKTLEANLRISQETLETSQQNTENLRIEADALMNDIRNWELRYQDLETERAQLREDSQELETTFNQLQTDFSQIEMDFENYRKNSEAISQKLNNRNKLIYIGGGILLGVIAVETSILIFR